MKAIRNLFKLLDLVVVSLISLLAFIVHEIKTSEETSADETTTTTPTHEQAK